MGIFTALGAFSRGYRSGSGSVKQGRRRQEADRNRVIDEENESLNWFRKKKSDLWMMGAFIFGLIVAVAIAALFVFSVYRKAGSDIEVSDAFASAFGWLGGAWTLLIFTHPGRS